MNVVEAHGLTKAYGRKRAVDRLDMHVAQGSIYGFVGKNGAGKSTVMKMICGLVASTEGEVVLFDGIQEAAASRTGALIEEPGLLPGLSAYENLMAKALVWGTVDAKARCEESLVLVGLEGVGKKKVEDFSLGMKQRLGLALALSGSPDLLLLDEPLNGLDPEGTRAMRNLLIRLNQTYGITIIISSHVLDQLDRVATCYGVIAHGSMVREVGADQVQAECGDSLQVRTADPTRTLALLQDAMPQAVFRAEPDGSLIVSGAYEAEAVSHLLHETGQTVLELSVMRRDIEDYFLELMEGRGTHV